MLRFAAYLAAALVWAAAMPASAGQIDVDKYKAACNREYAEALAKGNACVVKKMGEETERVNNLAVQIEQQAASIRRNNDCKAFLIDGAEAHRFTKEQIVAALGGKVTNEIIEAKICDAARSLGF